jgi:hypothetical protein
VISRPLTMATDWLLTTDRRSPTTVFTTHAYGDGDAKRKYLWRAVWERLPKGAQGYKKERKSKLKTRSLFIKMIATCIALVAIPLVFAAQSRGKERCPGYLPLSSLLGMSRGDEKTAVSLQAEVCDR